MFQGVIFQPVVHPLLIVLLALLGVGGVVWMLVRARPGSERVLWVLRLMLVLACVVLLMRPGLPGGQTQTLATDTDVFIVVDTTASIVAEDWAEGESRLNGVREDVRGLVAAYPGARFSLITFDAAAEQRLPLTTDTTALVSAVDVLRPEVTSQSRGSSISLANNLLADALRAAAESAPERARLVFYMGDGEQTSDSAPESFASSAEYIVGGAVLGYGTAEGGPMRLTTGGFENSREFIQYQGAPALSVIDEVALQQIADELGVEYLPRSADVEASFPPPPTTTTEYREDGVAGNVTDLSWIVALIVAALLAFEITRATMLITRMRTLSISGGEK